MKPLAWIVWADGKPYRFTQRAKARGFAMIRKASGQDVRIEPVFTPA